ncbi:MAG: cell division protein ZipA [Xanthomonadaceae bacterium]|jgi:cell division protein ZipA|nr:cell division protein ZipA [Xanthomonadaceae bacterium]
MSDVTWLRIGILIAGALLVAAIFFFSRPRKAQGRRVVLSDPAKDRREPIFDDGEGHDAEGGGDGTAEIRPELGLGAAEQIIAPTELGKRTTEDFDKILTLFVAARVDQVLRGEDIVVAAEKTGMVFGHMDVFHRLLDGHPERGPVFSMASIMNPGSFDMANIREMQTPAIAFFLTLPAPIPALDAWEKMLPTVQRIAELLDGVVLDDSRNALGRQRIAHIREDLRLYDRQHEVPRW